MVHQSWSVVAPEAPLPERSPPSPGVLWLQNVHCRRSNAGALSRIARVLRLQKLHCRNMVLQRWSAKSPEG
ncbi:hypothetical protein AMTR_s00136p00041720 [Amborella trichopoda]|uniref:Uncharacterized protein n=1 Tax=Amborella trichopoda TaxID=13333 RepID=W1NFL5_AMBTC|nr:hypothetical protein AMTR_s00136p00041720 [Amborella trichopoda]